MKWIGRISACLGALSVAFMSVTSFHAYADSAPATRVLTPAQTRALLGDNLTMTYFDGSDYQTASLTYATNTATKDATDDFGYNSTSYNLFNQICPDGTRYLVYYATIPDIVPTVAYPTVQITPAIQFSDVSLASFILGFSAPASGESSQYNFVQYYVNGNQVINHVFQTDGSPTTTAFRQDAKLSFTINNATRYFMCAPVYYNSNIEHAYISDITYKQAGTVGTDIANGIKTIRFIISCPTISADTGSIGSTSGGGSIGTDLEATNRKLDTIIQILNTIASQSGSDSETPEGNAEVNSANNDFGGASDSADDLWDAIAAYDDIQDDINSVVIDDDSGMTFNPLDIPSNVPDIVPSANIIDSGNYIIDALELDEDISPVMPMILVSMGICLFSYILFGKWV